MTRRLVVGLALVCGGLVLVLGFLLGMSWNRRDADGSDKRAETSGEPTRVVAQPGQIVERPTSGAPPAPKAVAAPDRVRQVLRPGKTYVTQSRATLHVRGTDKDWGLETVVTINCIFEAQIDREIERNDGSTIVELRHFRDVRALKTLCELEDVRFDLGPLVGPLLPQVHNQSLAVALKTLRLTGVSPEKLLGMDQQMKAVSQVSELAGKSVRLTYVDGKGVLKVEAVRGSMTEAERDFHLATVLLSDSLIVPNTEINIGQRWSVDGSNFSGLIDPGLLAQTAGELVLERAPDHLVSGRTCRRLQVASGRLRFQKSTDTQTEMGHFDPEGSMDYSPDDGFIVAAKLRGRARFDRVSKNHLLFEARLRQEPELELQYSCRVVDSLKRP